MISPTLHDRAVAWNQTGMSAAEMIPLLKQEGATKIQAIWLLRNLYDLSLREADELVLHSAAWENQFASSLALREAFFDAWESGPEQEEEDSY